MKIFALLGCLLMGSASALNLPVPPGYPTLLSHSCGGVAITAYVTGFDENGDVTGELYAKTTCNGSGRRSQPTTYTSVTSITWDFFGNYLLRSYDNEPLVSIVTADAYGNVAQVVGNVPELNINQMPPNAQPLADKTPSVLGLTESQALAALTKAQLVGAVVLYYSPYMPNHTVFNQSPSAGVQIPFGGTVTIYVSYNSD